jgi:hypothetical protein
MVTSIPFACIRTEGISARGVEFTSEVQSYLHLLGFGQLIEQTIYNVPIDKGASSGDRIEQSLHLIHEASTEVPFPPLALKRNLALSGVLDLSVGFDCFGICFYELVGPSDLAARKVLPMPPLQDSSENDAIRKIVGGLSRGSSTKGPANAWTREVGHTEVSNGDDILKVVSKHKIRAMLLVATPRRGECGVCLYVDDVTRDEVQNPLK